MVHHLLLLPVQLLLHLDHPLQSLPQLLALLLLLPLLVVPHLPSRPSRSHRPSQLGAGTLGLSILFVSFPILFLGFSETNLKINPGDEALFASLRGLRRQLVGGVAGSRYTARLLVADNMVMVMRDLVLAVSRSILVASAVVLDDHVNVRLQALPVIPIITIFMQQ